jgi:hypothetical protein
MDSLESSCAVFKDPIRANTIQTSDESQKQTSILFGITWEGC